MKLSKALGSLQHLTKFNQKFQFRFTTTKSEIYLDKTPLKEEEINKILYKNVQKANLTYESPKYTLDSPSYNENIEKLLEIVKETKQQNEKSSQYDEEEKQRKEDIDESQTQSIIPTEDPSSVSEIKYYKYGLPIPNQNPKVEDDYDKKKLEKLPPTITMNVFELFKMDKESSYEYYEKQAVEYLNVAQDMYGRVLESAEKGIQIQYSRLENNAIPMNRINNEKYMAHILECYSLNLSMPGTIENEHPHRFIKNIRPVEEFRHTPLIPISERQMKEFQDKVEASHRRGFLLEVKKDSVYQIMFALFILSIVYQIFQLVLQKEEQYGLAFQRLKNKRLSQGQNML